MKEILQNILILRFFNLCNMISILFVSQLVKNKSFFEVEEKVQLTNQNILLGLER